MENKFYHEQKLDTKVRKTLCFSWSKLNNLLQGITQVNRE